MAYDRSAIMREVARLLNDRPGLTATEVAARIGLDRHTLTRVIRLEGGCSFRALKDETIRLNLSRRLQDSRPSRHLKEVASDCGCSKATLFRWLKRWEIGRS
jgi:transposase-like protein